MNNWLKLSEIMDQLILNGCIDEEELKRLAYKKAQKIFADEINRAFETEGIKKVREIERKIVAYINWWVGEKKNAVRKGGEDYRKINLEIVRERMIKCREQI